MDCVRRVALGFQGNSKAFSIDFRRVAAVIMKVSWGPHKDFGGLKWDFHGIQLDIEDGLHGLGVRGIPKNFSRL